MFHKFFAVLFFWWQNRTCPMQHIHQMLTFLARGTRAVFIVMSDDVPRRLAHVSDLFDVWRGYVMWLLTVPPSLPPASCVCVDLLWMTRRRSWNDLKCFLIKSQQPDERLHHCDKRMNTVCGLGHWLSWIFHSITTKFNIETCPFFPHSASPDTSLPVVDPTKTV